MLEQFVDYVGVNGHLNSLGSLEVPSNDHLHKLFYTLNFVHGIIPYIVYYVSYRAEASVSSQRFDAQYQENLSNSEITESLRPYLQYHIISQYSENAADQASILNYDSSGSILDYYETLVSVSQMSATECSLNIMEGVGHALNELGRATDDDRLIRVVSELGYQSARPENSKVLNYSFAYEAFILGKNELVLSIAGLALENSDCFIPGDLLLFALASLDPAVGGASCQAHCCTYPIVQLLREMLSGEGASKTAKDSLWRFAWALDGSVASHLLRSVINSEDYPVPDLSESAASRYPLIGMGKYHPIQSWWSSSFQKMAELQYSSNGKGTTLGYECQHLCSFCLDRMYEHVGKEYRSWECARQLIRTGNYAQALDHAQNLEHSTNPFYRNQAVFFTICCLLELGEIEKCIETVTDFLILHPHSSDSLPLVRLVAAISPGIREDVISNISYPILCHAFTISTGGRESYRRSDAAEDFLASHKLCRPSQLRDITEKFSSEKLLQFLHDICVEQVMDTWIEFTSSEDVALERVEVCKLLTDLCPEKSDIYQSEIRDIMRRLTIRKRITEVEKSKIYVDTESVKKVSKRTLREDFERYRAFRRAGMSTERQKAIESALTSLIGGNAEEFLALKFPRDEMNVLLEKMVVHLRDEFVGSSQHGLDGYLSVRIRHGTLEGQLRSAFEAESLLSQRCSENEDYSPNLHWLERLNCDNPRDVEVVTQSFREFSSQFDLLVHVIKKDWIQIKKKLDDVGRIDFTLLSAEIDYIGTRFTEDTTLSEFIDLVLDYFVTEKLDPSLKGMRMGIQTEIKPRLNDLLTQLQTSIEKIEPTYKIHELRSAIGRARTSGQNTLDRIAGWLRLAKTETKEPFLLDEVISISESSVRASCPEFSVVRNIDSGLEELLLLANLPSFVDVICLIFDNIVRRSGLAPFPQGEVMATYTAPYIRIRVVNEVVADAATVEKRRRVDEIKAAVRSQPFSQFVSKEGGTGFIKVQKILNHDFRSPIGELNPELDFGFLDDTTFFVDIGIPIHSERILEDEE